MPQSARTRRVAKTNKTKAKTPAAQRQKRYLDKLVEKKAKELLPTVITPDMMPFQVQTGASVQEILELNSAAFMNWVFSRVAQRAAGAGGLYDDLGDKLILMLTHKFVPTTKGMGDKPPELRGTPKEQMRLLQRVMDTIGADAEYREVKVEPTQPSMDIGPRPDLAPARSAPEDDGE